MKLANTYLSIVLFLLCSIHGNAQSKKPAGYMGKRIFVGIPVSYSPNLAGVIDNPKLINKEGIEKFYMLNPIRKGISIGYVIADYRSLVLDVETQKFGISNQPMDPDRFMVNVPTITYDYSVATATNFRLRFLGNSRNCAPVGVYGGPVAVFVLIDTEVRTYNGLSQNTGTIWDAGIGYNGGFRRIFLDKVMIGISIEYNFLVRSLPFFISESEDYNAEVQKHAVYKNFLNNFVPCRFALYYLL